MSDDHINLAAASDGTLYAAVKTSYDTSGLPVLGLLVRRPSGKWDGLHSIDNRGTRPVVALNEELGRIVLLYTSSDSGGNIVYRISDTAEISFGGRKTLISGENLNNVSIAKQDFVTELVVICSTEANAREVVGVALTAD